MWLDRKEIKGESNQLLRLIRIGGHHASPNQFKELQAVMPDQ